MDNENGRGYTESQDGIEKHEISPEAEAKAFLFQALGFNVENIASPESAPSVVDFARFWKEVGFAKRGVIIPRDHEIYVGVDFKPRKKIFEVTEVTKGEQYSVTPKRPHFIELHNEPDEPEITNPVDELYDNLPDLHYGDMLDMLDTGVVYCTVIVRMIDDKTAGVVMGIKTDAFNGDNLPLKLSSEYFSKLRNGIDRTFENDDTLMLKNGLAVYRGFVELPPRTNRNYLKLRKPD
jgi:hypothetical protein